MFYIALNTTRTACMLDPAVHRFAFAARFAFGVSISICFHVVYSIANANAKAKAEPETGRVSKNPEWRACFQL